jgi:hypothetical protein
MRKVLGFGMENTVSAGLSNFNNNFFIPTNFFRDNDSFIVGISASYDALVVITKGKNVQGKKILPDLPSGTNLINSCVILNEYLYLFNHEYQNTGTRSVLRYNIRDINLPPTILNFSGLIPGVSMIPNPVVHMTSDGNYFYFSHNTGNNLLGDSIISKYSLSGLTLSYVSSINLSFGGGIRFLLANPIKGFLTANTNRDNRLRKFNLLTGLIQWTSPWPGMYGYSKVLNDKNINYYSYNDQTGLYEIFYVE